MNKPSERRLVENEMVFRQLNEQVQKAIDEVNRTAVKNGQSEMQIMQGREGKRLHFYCECSSVDCVERVVMSYEEYKRLHRRRDHFIVVPGHQVLKVERIIRRQPNYTLVEKYALPPVEVEPYGQNDKSIM